MTNTYCVYILANRSRGLYTGMGNNLERRMIEHREELVPGFTSRYKIFRLVHFELFGDVREAIAREKEIKGWRREKKIRLVERDNPTWADLAERLPSKQQNAKTDPSHRSPRPGDRVRDDDQAGARPADTATPRVIPNRATSQTDPTPRLTSITDHANAREGSASPRSSSVIPNLAKSQSDVTPKSAPGKVETSSGEGSAFLSPSSKPSPE